MPITRRKKVDAPEAKAAYPDLATGGVSLGYVSYLEGVREAAIRLLGLYPDVYTLSKNLEVRMTELREAVEREH